MLHSFEHTGVYLIKASNFLGNKLPCTLIETDINMVLPRPILSRKIYHINAYQSFSMAKLHVREKLKKK